MPPPPHQPPSDTVVTIHPVTSPQDLTDIATLFTAYATSLGIDLSFQSFAEELSSLPGKYSSSAGGALFLARSSSSSSSTTGQEQQQQQQAIGCIGLRALTLSPPPQDRQSEEPSTSTTSTTTTNPPIKSCEMKRLYLTPASRGTGTGRKLVDTVIRTARNLGYDEIRLDTLPSMAAARGLYEEFGFEETEKYYETPLEGTRFLRLRL